MIIDWHAHIYTPEEAADDRRASMAKAARRGASAAVRWCWRIFSMPTTKLASI
jgi:hypothetical protein